MTADQQLGQRIAGLRANGPDLVNLPLEVRAQSDAMLAWRVPERRARPSSRRPAP